jgi:hypothetical protein
LPKASSGTYRMTEIPPLPMRVFSSSGHFLDIILWVYGYRRLYCEEENSVCESRRHVRQGRRHNRGKGGSICASRGVGYDHGQRLREYEALRVMCYAHTRVFPSCDGKASKGCATKLWAEAGGRATASGQRTSGRPYEASHQILKVPGDGSEPFQYHRSCASRGAAAAVVLVVL